MKPFENLEAVAAPLPIVNVDTDKILPGRFLKTISRHGLGAALFASLRQDPQFILNREPWNRAEILVALDNFGCGSSREHAPWALADYGIRCIIAPSIADIFYNNCLKNGILPIILDRQDVDVLLFLVADCTTAILKVDLEAQTVAAADGSVVTFEIDAQRKNDLLAGLDEIGRSMECEAKIAAFEAARRKKHRWFPSVPLQL